ncbi:hypothetical protein E1262_25740 [Jiangella aurantiaca]|uniref:Uncharacterized protein n=1 Tax=Jiangella aurantiaca TaxID=2530373 RepID=A0A4R5A2R8_9ACTN|nr:hypothetical protein [Jiangella aurantiaca]TDD65270.1 hypothetical protein E1262_25740 [Jiangella aurantiaca]
MTLTERPTRPGLGATLRSAVADLFTVVGRAGRLLARHWPVLLAILFAGEAGRYAALWAAVELSDYSGTLGVLVLVLGPLAAVSALIAALYALRHSLPSLQASADEAAATGEDPATRRHASVVTVLGSVMIPFLAIYASYGYLSEDVFRFVNTAVTDELLNNPDLLLGTGEVDQDRTALATGWLAMALVAIAIVLRYGLGVLARRRPMKWVPWAAAYVEVLWLVTLARMLATHQEAAVAWIQERAVARAIADGWQSLLAFFGPVGNAVDVGSRWLFELLADADALLVIPVAWLTVGAVVYGQQLREPERRRQASHRRPRGGLVRRMHAPARQVGNELTGGLGDRFGALVSGLRRLAVAGLAPMLLFALAFVAAQRLEYAVELFWRDLLGPLPLDAYLAFAPHTSMVSHVIGTVVVVCLLGAAIDRVLTRGDGQTVTLR